MRRSRNSSNRRLQFILIIDKLFFVRPTVQFSNVFPNDFGRVFRRFLSHRVEMHLRARVGHIQQEVFRKRTVLNVGKNFLHRFLRVFRNHFRTGDIIAVFRRVGNQLPHRNGNGLVRRTSGALRRRLRVDASGL